jgi:hypothetical protein
MKGFRGTLIFAVLVLAVGGYAYWEYQKSQKEEEEKVTRDHVLREVNVDSVTEIHFKSPTINYDLKKENGVWRMVAPVADAADADAVLGQIRNIATQTVEEMDTGSETINWQQYGLTTPAGEFILKTDKGEEYRLQLGQNRTYDNGFYIKKNDLSRLIVGGSGWESYLNKTANDFRSKKLVVPDGDLQTIIYKSTDKNKRGEMTLKKSDTGWQFPEQPKWRVSSNDVESWLDLLRNLTGDSLVAEKEASLKNLSQFGLDKPSLKVALKVLGADKKEQILNIAIGVTKNDEAFFLADQNIGIYKITKARYEELLKTQNDLRDRQYPFQFNTDTAEKLSVLSAAGQPIHTYVKKDGNWTNLSSPNIVVKQEELKSVLQGLKDLKADEFLPKSAITVKGQTYLVQDAAGAELLRLQYGATRKATAGHEAYVVKTNLSDGGELMLVSKATLDALINKKLEEEVKKEP